MQAAGEETKPHGAGVTENRAGEPRGTGGAGGSSGGEMSNFVKCLAVSVELFTFVANF